MTEKLHPQKQTGATLHCHVRLLILLSLFVQGILHAQALFNFTAYDSNMGFVQKEVMNIRQDNIGQMWFATWDGLYKYDGYRFVNFKARPGDGIRLESNRLEKVCTDGDNIWMQGYNGSVSRYSTVTSEISNLPISGYTARTIYPVHGGGIFIIMSDNKLFYATSNAAEQNIGVTELLDGRQGYINKVETTKDGQTWILTSTSLWQYDSRKSAVSRISSGRNFNDMLGDGSREIFCGDNSLLVREGKRVTVRPLPTPATLTSIIPLPGNHYLVSTDGDGLFLLDNTLITRTHFTTANSSLTSNTIHNLRSDSYGNVWFCTGHPGVMRFDAKTNHLDFYHIEGEFSTDPAMWRNAVKLAEDSRHTLWVSPSGNGLARYDAQTNCLIPFYDEFRQKGWTAENTVVDMFVDSQDNLWFCGKYTGLEKATPTIKHFNTLDMHANTESGRDVRGLFQDRDGNVWVGAKNGVISVFDKNLNYIGDLTHDGRIAYESREEVGHAYSFVQDKTGTIWIGTKFNGLFSLQPKGDRTYKMINYRKDNQPFSLCNNDIFHLCIDHHDRLWIATFGKGLCYTDLNDPSHRFIHEGNLLKSYPSKEFQRTRFIATDQQGYIWVGTTSGLMRFKENFKRPEDIRFEQYKRKPDDANSLSNNDVLCVFFSRRGDMYVCTYGGGFCQVTLRGGVPRFQPFTVANGLRSDIILSMQEDEAGNLWLASENSIVKFHPSDKRIEQVPTLSFDEHININEGPAIRLSDGRLLFPARNGGAMYFLPQRMVMSSFVPKLIFSRLLIGQTEVTPSREKDAILRTDINRCQQIELDYRHNSFSVEFAALDFRAPENISYAYRLEGVDRQWNNAGNSHSAVYNNLPPGTYTLHVRSTNSDGVWVNNQRSLTVVIHPSFWQSGWGHALWGLIILAVIALSSYILSTVYRLKHKIRMESELAELKVKLFTDISHEIRTPLTLISGSIKEILRRGIKEPKLKQQLTVVNSNSDRLLKLMTQFLDIRKLQNGQAKMTLRQTNLCDFLSLLTSYFHNIAEQHNIRLSLQCPDDSVMIWCDTEKVDKIFFNLLSNAFRFTPDNKAITVTIRREGTSAVVEVRDEGSGIAPERQASIFDLFSSSDEGAQRHQPSSGIGLALTRELVELHRGTISVSSRLESGSTFTVVLPENAPGQLAGANYIVADAITPDDETASSDDRQTPQEEKPDALTLLIVEDNEQMSQFIRYLLQDKYNIIEARNGKEGMEMALERQPDLIITDYMMPVMDGMKMAAQLRSDVSTSHIPIIILSAKTDEESKIQGLHFGIDDYMDKPFSADILRARIANILKKREELQERYRLRYLKDAKDDTRQGNDMNEADRQFMERVTDLLEKNISNGDLGVNDVASMLGMSRSVYFKKLKALTGLGPNEYLKSLRMRCAASLLNTGLYSMSDIAFKVGINDSHYFSKCFKAEYGMTPTEWKKRKEQ